MKWISTTFGLLACLSMLAVVSCTEESSTPPGISVESGAIETFAGETVVVRATVSDEVGIRRITLRCETLDVEQVWEPSGQAPVVFNLSHSFVIPADVDVNVPATVVIEAVSTSNKTTERELPVTYLPDTTDPATTLVGNEIGVDFDVASGIAQPEVTIGFTDDRGLASARLQIADISFDRTETLSGRSDEATFTPTFTATGSYNATLTIVDAAGNDASIPLVFGVMGEEPSNPVSDYPAMWIANLDENPADYALGYYQYMTRTAEYTYSVIYFAPKADTKVVFVPTQTLDGDDYFGRSPYSATKILNNKDYVIPVTLPTVGYYDIVVNVQAKTLTLTPRTPAASNPYGTDVNGYVWTDGYDNQTSPSTATAGYPMRMVCNLQIYAVAGQWPAVQFTDTAWANSWQPLYDSAWVVIGWGLGAGGNGASIESVGAGVYPTVFDMESMWVTIKKPQ